MNIVLLDRDGIVIADPPDERVDTEEKIELFDNSIEALRYFADNNFAVIFVTNQAGIAEGRMDEDDFSRIHAKVMERLSPSGVKILKTYVCPHGPEDGCACRKPKPTMILQAAQDFGLDLPSLYMVGDRQSDIMAGVNAGTKTLLVKTATVDAQAPEATYTAQNLLEAAKFVVNNTNS